MPANARRRYGPRHSARKSVVSDVYAQNPNGTYSPAEPMGWVEEHNWLQRLIFWLRRVEHCNDREGTRKR